MGIKWHDGTSWLKGAPKAHNGTSWTEYPVKVHDGTSWVTVSSPNVEETFTYGSQPPGYTQSARDGTTGDEVAWHDITQPKNTKFRAEFHVELWDWESNNHPAGFKLGLGTATNYIRIHGWFENSGTYNEAKMAVNECINGTVTELYNSGNQGSGAFTDGENIYFKLYYESANGWKARIERSDGTLPYTGFDSGWLTNASTIPSDYLDAHFESSGDASQSYARYNSSGYMETFNERYWNSTAEPNIRSYIHDLYLYSE